MASRRPRKRRGPRASPATLAGFSSVKRKKINSYSLDTTSGCRFLLGPFPFPLTPQRWTRAPQPQGRVGLPRETLLQPRWWKSFWKSQGDGERGVVSERPDVPQARRRKPGECQTPNALGTNVCLLFMQRRIQEVAYMEETGEAFASSFLQLCSLPADESSFMS